MRNRLWGAAAISPLDVESGGVDAKVLPHRKNLETEQYSRKNRCADEKMAGAALNCVPCLRIAVTFRWTEIAGLNASKIDDKLLQDNARIDHPELEGVVPNGLDGVN